MDNIQLNALKQIQSPAINKSELNPLKPSLGILGKDSIKINNSNLNRYRAASNNLNSL